MTKYVKHFNAPSVYLAGPDDDWRATVGGVKINSAGDYGQPGKTNYALAGPKRACNNIHGPNELFVTERVWAARDASFVFGYFKDAFDYMTIAEISFAVAMGVNVYLVVGPNVSEVVFTALSFLGIDNVTRVANDIEAKAVFEKTLKDVIKCEKRTFFTIEEDELQGEELAKKKHVV